MKINKFFNLAFLNISIVVLVGLIVWFTADYLQGKEIHIFILVAIILLIPLVIYLIKNVTGMYRQLDS
jgi:hypothetical protein|tara:strand:+ start:170 stop:373 length:204 start_codon:yes stop_codon:yes gene_type:complete